MTLQVIGAGFGRTGTLSMKAALEQLLAGPAYHMETILHSERHLAQWHAWARDPERSPNWDVILDGFVAVTDAPMCFFVEELLERHPDAKVVLTVRDPAKWVRSFKSLMMTNIKNSWMALFFSRSRRFGKFGRVMGGKFVGSLKDEALIETFNAHNQRIRDLVPAGQLLEMEVKDGWSPLCEFLDVPEPSEPFPRRNEGMATIKRGHWDLALGRYPQTG